MPDESGPDTEILRIGSHPSPVTAGAPFSSGHVDDGRGPRGSRFRRARRRPRGWWGGITIIVIVTAIGVAAWAVTRSSGPDYQLASASMGNVEATLDGVATIAPVNQADLAFPISGTVSAVDVSVGQHVSVGQDVASLDTTPLSATVTADEADVANAEAQLSAAEASETATTTDSQTATDPTTSSTASAGASTGIGNAAAISADQAALLTNQRQVDTDQAQTTRDLTAAVTACGGTPPSGSTGSTGTTPPSSPTETPHVTSVDTTGMTTTSDSSSSAGTGASRAETGSESPSVTGTGSSGTGSSGTGTGTGTGTAACTAALDQVSTGEKAVTQDITTLEKAENTLSEALKQSSGAAPSATSGNPSGTAGASSASSPAKGSGAAPTTALATPQQLALDQAQIDLDDADLASAQQSLADATLTSPIAGTVASVGMTAGQSVAAGGSSTTDDIVILGPGSFEATTPVSVSDLSGVHLGQAATVTPLATGHAVPATVTAIGLLATTTDGTTTYPVTLTLDATHLAMLSGDDGDVAIVLAKASHVVTVPTSAVSTIGSAHFVTTYVDGKATRTRVDVGTVGAIHTQVTSGLHAGTEVVLADLSEPLPTSGSTTAGRGPGGFGGGGFGGGGFGGAGGGAGFSRG